MSSRAWFVWATWVLLGLGPWAGESQGQSWPQFRGPTGQGTSNLKNVPVKWSETENVAWKTVIDGRGWSSPSVDGRQIWLTSAADEDLSLRAVCLDLESGKVEHQVEVFRLESKSKIHNKNTPASPSAWISGDRVFVHFGKMGTACLDRKGQVLWRNNEMDFDHRHGPGGSPVLVDDLLVFNCDGSDRQFIVALDAATGKERWRTERDGAMAYSTPLLIEVDGRAQLVSACGEWMYAYQPSDGKELWKVRYPSGYSNVPRPVFGNGLVYVSSGYNSPKLYAVKPNGEGDVTETHVAWIMEKGGPLNPSPVVVGERLYVVSDQGILTCLNAVSGEEVWRQRLGGNYSASLLNVEDRIYALSETGVCTVFAHADEYRELSVNELPGRTLSTPTPITGGLLLRTDGGLYRLGSP